MTGTQLFFAIVIAEEVRKLTNGNVPLIWGGSHPSILPEQTLESNLVDIVVIGEGDYVFYDLVKAIEHKRPLKSIEGIGFKDGKDIILTPPRQFADMDSLLPTPWDLVNIEDYICVDNYFLKDSPRTLDIGQTSRGCPYRCGFCCSSSILKKKWRGMSVERSLEAIMEPVKKYKLTGFWLRDDEFYVKGDRAFSICNKVAEKKLQWYATGSRIDDFNRFTDEQISLIKRSGGRITKFGAESGSNRILDLIQKGIHVEDTIKANEKCKKHGIIPAYSLIIGFPTETFEDINSTIDLAFKLKKDNPQAQLETFPTYTPFPCTPMWPLALKEGLIPPDKLAGWVDWIMDDYDLEGKQIPWFNKKERLWIGNITYLSILGNTVGHGSKGIEDKFLRLFFQYGIGSLQKYYNYRLKKKYYKTLPEFAAARYLRKKIFLRNEKNIR
jgi:radical SAM superfamily enzyme YgiQ (UPF0313 family)